MTPRPIRTLAEKRRLVKRLRGMWARHDALEREILLVERRFTDRELRRLGAAAGG